MLISGCARESSPTGGPQDVEAPKAVRFDPPNYSTNFTKDGFKVKFDEYIVLQNVSEELIVSPPLDKQPKAKVRGKKLLVKFSTDSLKKDRTYIFNFNNAVADNNENNKATQFRYAFSTGNVIDSLKVEGVVYDSKDNKPAEGVSVFLYSNMADSAPRTILPDYVAKTDTKGFFSFNSLANRKYRIFALDDANRNMLFDQQVEKIAFGEDTVKPGAEYRLVVDTVYRDSLFSTTDEMGNIVKQRIKIDSVVKEDKTVFWPLKMKLFLFENQENKQLLLYKNRNQKELVTIGFSQPLIDGFYVIKSDVAEITDNQYILEQSAEGDSLSIWLTDTALVQNDSLRLVISYKANYSSDSIANDTISPRYLKSQKKRKVSANISTNITGNVFSLNDSLAISLSKPIGSFDKEKIFLYETVDSSGFRNHDGRFYDLDTSNLPVILSRKRHQYPLYFPDSVYEQQGIKKSQRIKNRFYVKLKIPENESSVDFELVGQPILKNWYVRENDLSENIVYCWITDSSVLAMKDQRINAVFHDNNEKHRKQLLFSDYLFEKKQVAKVDKLDVLVPEHFLTEHFLDEYLLVLSSNPIAEVDTSKIELIDVKDSIQEPLPFKILRFEGEPMRFWIDYDWKASRVYELTIEKDAIKDIYGNRNKESVFAIKTQGSKLSAYRTAKYADFETDPDNIRNVIVNAEFEAGKNYEIAISPGALTDVYGKFADSTLIVFKTLPAEEYGIVVFDCQHVGQDYILVLEKGEGEEVGRQRINASRKARFENLLPEKYRYYIIEDTNVNGKWDSGSYDEGLQPEKRYFIAEPVEVKKDWEMEVPVDFQNLHQVSITKK